MPVFKNIVSKILQKTPLTITSVANVRNAALRRCMLDELAKKNYSDEGILAKPFYEAIFPWEGDSRTLKERCDKKEVHPIIADLHCKELKNGKKIDSLYKHQRRAIEAIRQGKSIVVTTGTGSGKTECFMYPIFDYLANKIDEGKELKGIQALFLYPLNALIQSQGDRFERFCREFNEKNPENKVHYANYTGKMQETYAEAIIELHKQNPNLAISELEEKFPEDGVEYIDRTTLRRSVPQFLITNSTMLEYALIRKSDAPLFANSDLKFVVLDEAHSYTGSNATELAMRLRRVLLAFGKKPSDVQFIMTSATVGQENDVKKFLADITDVNINNVECINGKRIVPELRPVTGQKYNVENALRNLKECTDETERFNILCRTDKALQLRKLFISGSGRLSQDSLNDFLHLKSSDTIDFLDFASSTKNADEQYFLPLKMHVFQKHFPGVWACCNPKCSGKQTSLQGESSDWRYGRVYFDINDVDKAVDENDKTVGLKTCSYCNHNILQVASCRFCGEIYLAGQAEWDDENNKCNLIVRIPKVVDEISSEEDDDDEDFSNNSNSRNGSGNIMPVLVHWIPENARNYRREWLEYIKKGDGANVRLCSETEKINDLGLITFSECQVDKGRCHNCSMPFHIPNVMNANGSFPIGNNTNISGFGASSKILYSSLVKDVLMEDSEVDKNLPTGGRKLLGFTDSRQGTAYYAGMQGIVSEMAATRVWILNYLFKNSSYSRDRLVKKIKLGISHIGKKRFHLPNGMERKDEESLANLFIWREITFRNRRKRSLETLGLLQVKYDGLEDIRRPDGNLQQYFASDKDYQDLLKIILDYGFRKTGALSLSGWDDPAEIRRAYAGTAVFIKPFDLSYFEPQQKPNRLNGVANILRYYIEKNVTERQIGNDEWKIVCQLAKKSIEDLLGQGIIEHYESENAEEGADEYRIDWTTIILTLPSKIWMCPSTKTLLDVVIYKIRENGEGEYFSPYIVSTADWGRRLPLSPDSAEDLTDIWNSDNKREAFIKKFEDCIWWTDLHQDVLSSCDDNDAYVVSQEDTAQISSIQRAKDQEDFKQGKINILNCSTTMEMGVDIGDVSLVSMTNVPPHEYNYVQRAGRAGRAGQGQSFVWTMSSFGGHERKAIKNPLQWVEKCTLKQKLNLENQTIVQRHFNSYLLAEWIRKQDQFTTDFEKKIYEFFIGKIGRLEWTSLLDFLLRKGSSTQIVSVDKFRDLLEEAMKESPMQAFINEMQTIIVNDALLANTNCPKNELMQHAYEMWNDVYKSWENNIVNYYDSIIDGLDVESIVEYGDIPMKNRAILRHLKKELMDYGLGYLIKKGILPSNGMPIDVVSLELPNSNPNQDSANDRNEFPSRERKIAIREFAPGYSLIVDGQRLVTRGISLRPCPKSMSGDTLIRSYYTCKTCGTPYISGIDGIDNSQEIRCSCCQELIQGTPRKIVEPIGFKVLESDRNLDSISKPPFEMPHIKLLPGFQNATFEDIFSINYGPAMVVYLNGNTTAANNNSAVGAGPGPRLRNNAPADSVDDAYCLCLNCGYTALSKDAMEKDSKESSSVHEVFAKKYGVKGCKSEHWRMVSLAAMNRTSATIIHIKQLKDSVSANTWALALRNALTSYLALDESEIGWASQRGTDGVYDIVLYDNAAGGANLCTKIKDNILTIFKRAKNLLECPSQCDSICLDCLLTRETQVLAHALNRVTALNKLDDKFFASLEIPQNKKYWDDETQFFPDFFKLSQETIKNNSDYEVIQFFLTGDETVSLMSDWPLTHIINQNRDKIRFVVQDDIWEKAKQDLYLKALMTHIYQLTGQLYTTEKIPVVKGAKIFMEKILHEEAHDYIVENLGDSDGSSLFENLWQAPQKLSTFYGKSSITPVQSRGLHELFVNGLNAKSKQVSVNKEYRIENLAETIFGDFKSDELLLSKKVSKLEFSDRYLFTPSAIRVVCELIKYFNPENVSVISTSGKNDSKLKARNINNAWACDYIARHLDILDKALHTVLPNANVTVESPRTPHDRSMLLTYEDGSTRLIQFTGSPTIWEMTPNGGIAPATIHANYLDIDPQKETEVILSIDKCPVKLNEATSVIVSK